MKDSDYCTASELAREWGVTSQWIFKLIRQGRIKSHLRFGRRLIRRDVERPEDIKSGPKPN